MFPSSASTNCHPFPLIEIHRSRRLLGLATGVTGVESQKQLGSWKTIASRCSTVCHCSTTTGDMGDIGDTGDRCATTTGEDIGDVNTVEMGDATGLRAMPAIGV
mmetsp:Transcript_16687/g.34884  ORF Transcript_16687/g.34884 Transcript_16687/m.34884 type:complete len:104 (+) Transcript_16687:15-326(+)